MEFDEELFPLEAELPDLGPGEGVDLGEVLEDEDAHARHRQVQDHTLVVLQYTQRKVANASRLGQLSKPGLRIRIDLMRIRIRTRIQHFL
jgi:hypothetical protein